MTEDFILPPALERGDKIAIVGVGNGPTSDLFPEVYELGIKRLKEVFDLEPVEYPTATMDMEERTENPKQRAEELMEAFRDDDIKGVMAPIGGSGEELRILKHLDPEVLRNNPTRFYGYSDNTSLNLYLWKHGIVSFQGPMIMTELAMQGEMHDYTVEHAEKVFFENSIGEVEPSEKFTDETLDWNDPENLEKYREMEDNPGWEWYNTSGETVEGRIWGGCLDVVEINLQANKPLPEPEELEGKVLALETSEEMPDQHFVDRFMMSLGERDILEKFSAILVGKAKARHNTSEPSPEEREEFRETQKQVIKERVDEYAPGTPIVFDFNFGHADPIVPLPIGGEIKIDTENKEIELK
jgi:muramoyltetrapeptide carboxypeptidase LdcA involved in peptidoglycan recycling